MVFEVRGAVFTTPSKGAAPNNGRRYLRDSRLVSSCKQAQSFTICCCWVKGGSAWKWHRLNNLTATCGFKDMLIGISPGSGPNCRIKQVLWSKPVCDGDLFCCVQCRDSLWPCVMHWLQLTRHRQGAAWVMMWVQGFCLAKVTTLHLRGTCKILKTQQ